MLGKIFIYFSDLVEERSSFLEIFIYTKKGASEWLTRACYRNTIHPLQLISMHSKHDVFHYTVRVTLNNVEQYQWIPLYF